MATLSDFKNLNNCPICGKELDILPTKDNYYVVACNESYNFSHSFSHKISIQLFKDKPQLCQVQYRDLTLYWFYENKLLYAYKKSSKSHVIVPWIEPDFSDYDNFHKRIEKLLVFL